LLDVVHVHTAASQPMGYKGLLNTDEVMQTMLQAKDNRAESLLGTKQGVHATHQATQQMTDAIVTAISGAGAVVSLRKLSLVIQCLPLRRH
jgi:hypothetical protein